jgi:hypothetical protein
MFTMAKTQTAVKTETAAQPVDMLASIIAAADAKKAARKTAAKPADAGKTAAKPADAGKTAAKPADAGKTAAKPADAGKALFAIRPGYRPDSGARLFAYTRAWLQATGMMQGGSVPKSEVIRFAGASAVKHHTESTGRFVESGGAIKLAPGAAEWFAKGEKRKHETAVYEKFLALVQSGKADGEQLKNAAGFDRIAK